MNIKDSKGKRPKYYHFMRENLFDHINVKEENTYIPDGEKEDIDAVCRDLALIRKLGGVDLQNSGSEKWAYWI